MSTYYTYVLIREWSARLTIGDGKTMHVAITSTTFWNLLQYIQYIELKKKKKTGDEGLRSNIQFKNYY